MALVWYCCMDYEDDSAGGSDLPIANDDSVNDVVLGTVASINVIANDTGAVANTIDLTGGSDLPIANDDSVNDVVLGAVASINVIANDTGAVANTIDLAA